MMVNLDDAALRALFEDGYNFTSEQIQERLRGQTLRYLREHGQSAPEQIARILGTSDDRLWMLMLDLEREGLVTSAGSAGEMFKPLYKQG